MKDIILPKNANCVNFLTLALIFIAIVGGCKSWGPNSQSNVSNESSAGKSTNAPTPTPAIVVDTPEKTFNLEPDPSKVRFFPGAKSILTTNFKKEVNVWDLATGNLKASIKDAHPKPILDVEISSDGKHIATTSYDGVRLWETSGKLVRGWTPLLDFEPHSVAISPRNDIVAASSLKDAIRLWDATGVINAVNLVTEKNMSPKSIAFSPDGRYLVAGGLMGGLAVWEVPSGKIAHDIKLPDKPDDVTACFSPDGKWIVAGVLGGTVYLIDAASGNVIHKLKGHSSVPSVYAFSPDGKTLASGANDNSVVLWDVATGKNLRTIHAHSSYVSAVTFTTDGKMLLSASSLDKTVKYWKLGE